MKALDLDAVQAFVLVAELKSFTRAAEVLDTTQSAISLKIKRLEETLGRRLFERTPRVVRLSADGGHFLEPARALSAAHRQAWGAFTAERRRLVVGISHHIVGADLSHLIRRMGALEPHVVLELRISTSLDMLDQFDAGQLDAAFVLRHDNRRQDGEVAFRQEFGWMATPDFEHPPGEPLRLATQPGTCGVRAMVVGALERAGIAWTEVFVGGGFATLGAAVSSGLAVAALARRVAPPGAVDVGARLGLPELPGRDVVVHSRAQDGIGQGALRSFSAILRTARS